MDSDSTPLPAGHLPPALMRALLRLLRPLVRFLLSQGITYPLLIEQLKELYVDVASQDFRLDEKRQTDSRVSLISGVHRKDVRRLRDTGTLAKDAAPASVSLGAQLVAAWTGMPEYLDRRGRPLPLPRLARERGGVSFEGLVTSVSKDIRSRAVLDEWLRLGVARIDDEDRVCLNVEAFVPEKGFDEKAYYFGQNLADHIAAGAHNLNGGRPPFLDRSVYYDCLTPESVTTLAQMSERLGMKALKAINRKAMELERRDAGAPAARNRMNFGIYFFSTPRNDDEQSRPE
ncbi:MAG TPA: DUF6502 family protein [Burkholderiales bacterium]